MSNRRHAATPEGVYESFVVGARVMVPEGFPGVVREVLAAPHRGSSYVVELDNGMGGGEWGEGELVPLRQASAATASEAHTAADDYPELGTILSDRLPIRQSVPAHEYSGGRVLAKTADLYFDTPASDMLYEAASYVMSTAAQHMGRIVTAIDDWDDLRTRFACAACGHVGNQEPIPVLGALLDVCPACSATAAYDPVQGEGWPVAARASVVALWLPPTGDGAQAPEGRSAGWTDGYRDATTISARQPRQADAEYRSEYDMGWAAGVKVVDLHPDAMPLTDPDDLGETTVLAGLVDFIKGAPPKGQEEGRNYSFDWCRFRRSSHCYYPKTLDDKASAEAGYAVWNPFDRGMCPRVKWEDQKACPAPSEPGPHVPGGFPDATVSWDDGGQRDGEHTEQVLSALASRDPLVMEPEFRWHVTAAWSDVRAKAKRIRAEGGVRIVEAKSGTVVGHVKGDTNVYETRLVRMPGSRTSVANWECGCAWAAYSWGRSGRFKRFEGRMCSHALATQYEAQARGMFGREVREDPRQPAWMDATIPPRQWGDYDRDKARHSGLRPVAEVREAPASLVAASVLADGGDALAATAALVALGVRQAPLVAQAAGRGTFMARVRGVLVELQIRAGHVVDRLGDAVSGEILHPNFDPRRGLNLVRHGAKAEDHNGDDAEVTYWAHENQAGVALVKRVQTPTTSTYFYLDHKTGQWVEDNYWAYLSFKGSTASRIIDRREMQAIAATLGVHLLAALSPADQRYSDALEQASAAEEARLTPALKALSARYGGEMRGLRYRLKGHEYEGGAFVPRGRSVSEKIEKVMRAKGVSAERAASGIADALRYTMTFPEDDYAEAVDAVMDALHDMGHTEIPGKAKNYWARSDDDYNGVNVTMLLPSGHKWEIQFHTSKSYAAKMDNHPLYEAYATETDPHRRRDLYDKMAERSSRVPKPPGVNDRLKWMRRETNPRPVAASLDSVSVADEFPYWLADLHDEPEPALPETTSEDAPDDDDHDLPAMWAAAARIELALMRVAGCSACGGTGEQGTGHECYICDGSGTASAEAEGRADGTTNDNPENGLPVGLDLARGQAPVTAVAIPSFSPAAIRAQFTQYPQDGPDGISYFKGVIDDDWYVDCLLYREGGKLVGVLNHYPKDMGPEKKGNVLLLVDPDHQRKGIGTALWAEAKRRWDVKASSQDRTPEGRAFLDKHGVVVAADSEHAEGISEPKKVGDEWVIYAEDGREVARSKDKRLLEDYRQQRASARITAALADDWRLPMAEKIVTMFGLDSPGIGLDAAGLLDKSDAMHGVDQTTHAVKVMDRLAEKDFHGVGKATDDDGAYVRTHRARSDSYPTHEDIPQSEIDRIESTGAARHVRKTVQGPRGSGPKVTCSCGWARMTSGASESKRLHDEHLREMSTTGAYLTVDQVRQAWEESPQAQAGMTAEEALAEHVAWQEGFFAEADLLSQHEARLAAAEQGLEVDAPDPFAYLLGGGGDNTELAAAAQEYLAKTALKDFTPAERAAIIDEGMDVQAANLDRLDIAGTHYEALEATLVSRAQDEDDHSIDGMMWL